MCRCWLVALLAVGGAWSAPADPALQAELAKRAVAAGTVRAAYRIHTKMPAGALPAHEADGMAVLDYSCAAPAEPGGAPRERFLIDYTLSGRAGDEQLDTWFRAVYDGKTLRGTNHIQVRPAGAPAEAPAAEAAREFRQSFLALFLPAPGALLWRLLREEFPHIEVKPGGETADPPVHIVEARPEPDWPGYVLIQRLLLRIDAATGVVRSAEYFGPGDAAVLRMEATDWVVGANIPEETFTLPAAAP
jgi:hypothetical protein